MINHLWLEVATHEPCSSNCRFCNSAGSSDIHLEEGSPIAIRVNSDIRILENVLGPNDESSPLRDCGEEKLEQYNRTGDLDTSIGLEGLSRIRINAYKANEKRCLTLKFFLIICQDGKILAYHRLLLI